MTTEQNPFDEWLDLAAESVGGAAILANDEFFAAKENMLRVTAPEWREGEYTDRGKWMDGWETRRRRSPGHDWCIVRLGIPGIVHGVVVDTAFFRGNYPESCSIEACTVQGTPDAGAIAAGTAGSWIEILPRSPLQGDSRNAFPIAHDERITHLRLNIFPDGGVARLRVHGEGKPDRRRLNPGTEMDLAAAENGGLIPVCSDMFFGHRHNLILPGRSSHMGNGWETRRRRGPGHDWTIVRLGVRGSIHRVEIDTDHFKGNAPASAMLEVCDAPDADTRALVESVEWRTLLPEMPLQPHARHLYDDLAYRAAATHARLSIYPDGGIARLRLFGSPEPE